MKNRLRRGAACAAIAVGLTVGGGDAGAITQTFGATFSGHWVIGTYYRDGVVAHAPSGEVYAGGGALMSIRYGNQLNIARLAVGFTTSPCVRALGTATGTTWGDTSCDAL